MIAPAGMEFGEAQYLREMFNLAVWVLSGMGALFVSLIAWIYLAGESRTKHRIDEKANEVIVRLDAQDRELHSMKETLFAEVRVMRDYMHQIELRVVRLEWARRANHNKRSGDEDYDSGDPSLL